MPADLHPDLFPCTKCAEHFNTRDGQASHLQDLHGVQQPWLCYRCPNAFENRASHAEHMMGSHHKTAGFCPCPQPGCAQFPSEDILKRHTQHDHHEQEDREERGCLKCEFTNASCLGLSVHLLHEHSVKCQYCGEGFIKLIDLLRHEDGKGLGGECPAKPKPRAPTPPPPPPPKPLPPTLPSLPDFALLGRPDLSPADFNPNTVWDSTTASVNAYRQCPVEVPLDYLFHADPKMIAYGNILRLAESFTNTDIFNKVNAWRPQPVLKSVQTVESRITAALKWTAKRNNVSYEVVRDDFDRLRQRSGIYTRRAHKRAVGGYDMAATQHHAFQPDVGYSQAGSQMLPHIKNEYVPHTNSESVPYIKSEHVEGTPPPQLSEGYGLWGGRFAQQVPDFSVPTEAYTPTQRASSNGDRSMTDVRPAPHAQRYDTPAAAGGFFGESDE